MMLAKFMRFGTILALLALTSGLARAQTPAGALPAPAPRPTGSSAAPAPSPPPPGSPPADEKPLAAAVIGVLDMGLILRDGAPYKSLRSQIEKQSKTWDEELKKKSDELGKLEEAFQKQAKNLTQEQIAEKQAQFETQMADFQQQLNNRRRQLGEGEALSLQPIEQALAEILQQIAVERGINLILYRTTAALFASELDITEDALQRLNTKLPRVALKLPPPGGAPSKKGN